MRIDETFSQALCKKTYNLYFVNAEDGKVLHTYKINYSSKTISQYYLQKVLLLENTIKFANDKNKVQAIEDFKMELSVDKPLLSPQLKDILNPFLINVVGAKQIPVNHSKKYQPVYVKYRYSPIFI